MLNSRTIKQNITNSHQHSQCIPSSTQIILPSIKGHPIPDFIPEMYEQEDNNQEENYCNEDEANFGQIKSMFTIRQEQSYQYESEKSVCLRAAKCQSYIDHLSTIKAELSNQLDINSINKQISVFEPTLSEKMQENATMSSLHYNRMVSEEIISSRIACWDSKITMKGSEEEQIEHQEIEQQNLIGLKQSQKALNLDLMKSHVVCDKSKREKRMRNVDILYTCSEQEFEQIRKILEREGIKLIQRGREEESKESKQNIQKMKKTELKTKQRKARITIMKKVLSTTQKII